MQVLIDDELNVVRLTSRCFLHEKLKETECLLLKTSDMDLKSCGTWEKKLVSK